jgi:hypothetical protein
MPGSAEAEALHSSESSDRWIPFATFKATFSVVVLISSNFWWHLLFRSVAWPVSDWVWTDNRPSDDQKFAWLNVLLSLFCIVLLLSVPDFPGRKLGARPTSILSRKVKINQISEINVMLFFDEQALVTISFA